MKKILLTKGEYTIVDNDDYKKLSKYRWWFLKSHNGGYAARKSSRLDNLEKKQKNILMHREIMNIPNGLYCDHINRNKLDNRKNNLRIVSLTENNQNVGLRKDNTSGYKGVSWCKFKSRWRVQLVRNKIKISKYFRNKNKAKIFYNNLIKQYDK